MQERSERVKLRGKTRITKKPFVSLVGLFRSAYYCYYSDTGINSLIPGS